jgi:hypothetical protein
VTSRITNRELEYYEGRNLLFEPRWADHSIERTAKVAGEIAALHPAVIVTRGQPAKARVERATCRGDVPPNNGVYRTASGRR